MRRPKDRASGRNGAEAVCDLITPRDLEVATFSVAGDEYAVLSFPLPRFAPPPGLTAAEREVALGLVEGSAPAEIARRRNRSLATVRNQIRSLYEKLGVGSRAELVRICTASATRER